MNNNLKDAIDRVFNELMSLGKEEFRKRMKKHENGEFKKILIETGALDLKGEKNENS